MASSLEFNKALAAVLTAGIIASGAGVFSRIIYHPDIPEERAYPIDMAAVEGAGEEAASEQEEAMALSEMLAIASADSGETVARKCTSCHAFEEGGANKIGPALWGVLGRDIASLPDFDYSSALSDKEGDWGYEELDAFIANPKDWAPGTKMTFAGLSNSEDRADLLLYMRSMSAEPPPLPEVTQKVPEEQEQPAEGQETGEAASEEGQPAEEQQAAQDTAQEEQPAEEQQAAQGTAQEGQPAEEQQAAQDTAEEGQAAEEQQAAQGAAEEGQPAQDQEVAEASAQEDQSTQGSAQEGATGLGAMLASASAEAGQKTARKCATCHNFDEGGSNKIGPALWGVVGRDIASHPDFNYSDALSEKEGDWDYEKLNAYLENPKEWAPGNKMTFVGLRKDEERADVILYLRSLSDTPEPLPGG